MSRFQHHFSSFLWMFGGYTGDMRLDDVWRLKGEKIFGKTDINNFKIKLLRTFEKYYLAKKSNGKNSH